eukprot:m.1257641 g.1257641  ORF g.1257641 m.1257641 type:complete len:51 (+) comp24715_c0_seq24:1283-1435(+)
MINTILVGIRRKKHASLPSQTVSSEDASVLALLQMVLFHLDAFNCVCADA